ncbi:hypothetical protein pb186bvf_015081 [Paramecium bursaria]
MQDLRCPNPQHNRKKYVSLKLNDDADKRLFCFQCLQEVDLANSVLQQSDKYCDLDEVLDNNHYQVYNWPVDKVGAEIKEQILKFKTPEQQKKEVEEFFQQTKLKIIEQLDAIKQMIIDSITANAAKPEEKKDQQEPKDAKDAGKDKKETKKDDKKETKKDDKNQPPKKDDKKDPPKKDEKKDPPKQEDKEPEKPDLNPTFENVKKLYDSVYDLNKIKQIIKENSKVDPKILSEKLGDYLNDPKRKQFYSYLKDIFGKFKKDEPTASALPTSKELIQPFLKGIEDQIQTWPQYFGKVQWTFQPSQAHTSKQVIIDDRAFQGAGQNIQVIYSKEVFERGDHGCIILFDEYDNKRVQQNGNFIIGAVKDDNRDKDNYSQDIYRCLFNEKVSSGLVARAGSDFNNILKLTPKILLLKINVENDVLEVSDGKRQVVYGLEKDAKLKGNKWRFYIQWVHSADKFRILHSY